MMMPSFREEIEQSKVFLGINELNLGGGSFQQRGLKGRLVIFFNVTIEENEDQ